jgi:predicted transposase YdaD
MLDINKSKEILENYFANVTREQFAMDLEKYCPELVEAESANLSSEISKDTELYQQAKQESKLEIAPKLLKKGMSIQEVAELLELDVHLLAK